MSNERRLTHAQRGELEILRRAETSGVFRSAVNQSMCALERKGFAVRSITSGGATVARPAWFISPAGIERLDLGK